VHDIFRPTIALLATCAAVVTMLPKTLVALVVEVVELLPEGLSKAYRGAGSASYHPAATLSMLIMLCHRTCCLSRKLELAT